MLFLNKLVMILIACFGKRANLSSQHQFIWITEMSNIILHLHVNNICDTSLEKMNILLILSECRNEFIDL